MEWYAGLEYSIGIYAEVQDCTQQCVIQQLVTQLRITRRDGGSDGVREEQNAASRGSTNYASEQIMELNQNVRALIFIYISLLLEYNPSGLL